MEAIELKLARMAQTETYGDLTSTFTGDFNIAEDLGGVPAVKDTFDSAFASWKHDVRYLASSCDRHQSQELAARRGQPRAFAPLCRVLLRRARFRLRRLSAQRGRHPLLLRSDGLTRTPSAVTRRGRSLHHRALQTPRRTAQGRPSLGAPWEPRGDPPHGSQTLLVPAKGPVPWNPAPSFAATFNLICPSTFLLRPALHPRSTRLRGISLGRGAARWRGPARASRAHETRENLPPPACACGGSSGPFGFRMFHAFLP